MKLFRRLPFFLTCSLLAALLGRAATADFPNQPVVVKHIDKLTLSDEAVQALPAGIARVSVGPDDRPWFELNATDNNKEDLPVIKEMIAREFTEKMPQLYGARVMLFEPAGRVWFLAGRSMVKQSPGNTFIGYDGKDFILKDIDPLGGTCCFPPGHGIKGQCGNLATAGAAFFSQQASVLVYNAGQWTHEFTQSKASLDSGLCASTDGKKVYALALTKRQPDQNTQTTELMEWSDGKWTHHQLDFYARFLVAADNDRILLATPQKLFWYSLAQKKVVDEIPASDKTALGPYTASKISWFATAPDGTLQFISSAITAPGETAPGEGIILRDSKSEWKLIKVAKLSEKIQRGPLVGFSAALAVTGNRTWIPLRNDNNVRDPASIAGLLYAAGKPEPVAQFNAAVAGELVAAQKDGSLFVGSPITDFANSTGSLYLIRPRLPELSPEIAAQPQMISVPPVVTGDGVLWSLSPDKVLMRFSAGIWANAAEQPPAFKHRFDMLPGKDGSLLMRSDDTWCFMDSKGKIEQSADLRELIKTNAAEIVAAFPVDGPTPNGRGFRGLFADKGGNIWLLDPPFPRKFDANFDNNYSRRWQGLWVFVNGQWIDPDPALVAAGITEPAVRFMCPAADGKSVFLAPAENTYYVPICFASIQNGQVTAQSGPLLSTHPMTYGVDALVRDHEGALWLHTRAKTVNGPATVAMARWFDATKTIEVPNTRLELVDTSGNAWLRSSNTFEIYRGGKITSRVTPSGRNLRSDRAGSVYAWGTGGLEHYIENPAELGTYKLSKTWKISGLPRFGTVGTFFPAGFEIAGNYLVFILHDDYAIQRGVPAYTAFTIQKPE